MKKFIKLLLAGLLSISLIGCSSDSSSSSDDSSSDSISETETSSDVTEENAEIQGNVLMVNKGYDEDSGHDQYVLGSEYKREDIITITFLDTLNNIPSNAWDVSENNDESVMAWIVENNGLYDLYLAGDGGVDANQESSSLFYGYKNLTEINFNDCFFTSNVTDMSYMFFNCSSLTSLDLSTFNTSNVSDMGRMFTDCSSLTSLELSTFDTSNVFSMSSMFQGCLSLTSLDLSTFDTSNVTDMHSMFRECESLSSLDLSSFNTSNVSVMTEMFSWCKSLTDLDISSFDMSNVENDDNMFYNCPAGDEYDW